MLIMLLRFLSKRTKVGMVAFRPGFMGLLFNILVTTSPQSTIMATHTDFASFPPTNFNDCTHRTLHKRHGLHPTQRCSGVKTRHVTSPAVESTGPDLHTHHNLQPERLLNTTSIDTAMLRSKHWTRVMVCGRSDGSESTHAS